MDKGAMILCRSDAGGGGWSLHPPGTTDEAIANGDARILASGTADRDGAGWDRPNHADYRDAWHNLGPNSASQIAVEMIDGARFAGDDDRERAATAAAAYLNRAGIKAALACADYQQQWEEYDDEGAMHGPALLWIEARQAADIALTEGWADPNGASCSITA
jgi:hypothetical protein